jgi:hypothetical protein
MEEQLNKDISKAGKKSKLQDLFGSFRFPVVNRKAESLATKYCAVVMLKNTIYRSFIEKIMTYHGKSERAIFLHNHTR